MLTSRLRVCSYMGLQLYSWIGWSIVVDGISSAKLRASGIIFLYCESTNKCMAASWQLQQVCTSRIRVRVVRTNTIQQEQKHLTSHAVSAVIQGTDRLYKQTWMVFLTASVVVQEQRNSHEFSIKMWGIIQCIAPVSWIVEQQTTMEWEDGSIHTLKIWKGNSFPGRSIDLLERVLS